MFLSQQNCLGELDKIAWCTKSIWKPLLNEFYLAFLLRFLHWFSTNSFWDFFRKSYGILSGSFPDFLKKFLLWFLPVYQGSVSGIISWIIFPGTFLEIFQKLLQGFFSGFLSGFLSESFSGFLREFLQEFLLTFLQGFLLGLFQRYLSIGISLRIHVEISSARIHIRISPAFFFFVARFLQTIFFPPHGRKGILR